MKINVFSFDADVMYARKYLPTKKCRNVRTMTMLASHQFHVRKISSKEAPVAFKVTAFEANRTIRLFNGPYTEPLFNVEGIVLMTFFNLCCGKLSGNTKV